MSPQNKETDPKQIMTNTKYVERTDELCFENKAFQNEEKLENFDKVENVTDDAMDFDDILPYIGEFGKYQKLLFLMMIPFAFFVAFVYFTQIFITLVPEEHWCNVPELAHLTKEER